MLVHFVAKGSAGAGPQPNFEAALATIDGPY
jgi:hypothetical protein